MTKRLTTSDHAEFSINKVTVTDNTNCGQSVVMLQRFLTTVLNYYCLDLSRLVSV